MTHQQNPYAAPTADLATPGVEWIAANPVGLSKTAQGLSLVYFGIALMLVVALIGIVAESTNNAVPGLLYGLAGGTIIAMLMMFVGPIFCLSVPDSSQARGLIIWSVVFQVICCLSLIFSFFVGGTIWTAQFGQVFGFISGVLFILFMRKLAIFIERYDLAARARNILILAGVVIAVTLVSAPSLVTVPGSARPLLTVVIGIMMIALFLMYANLINSLRKVLKPN